MKYNPYISHSVALAVLMIAGQSSFAANISCQYNSESGALEATLPWRNTLGAAADKACADADSRRLRLNRATSSPSSNSVHQSAATFVPPSQSSTLSQVTTQPVEAVIATTTPQASLLQPNFVVTNADKSVVKLIVRWAKLAGYEVQLNETPVTPSFPKHAVAYVDLPISSVAHLKAEANFPKAMHELRSRFNGSAYEGLIFQAVVDSQDHIAYIQLKDRSAKHKRG